MNEKFDFRSYRMDVKWAVTNELKLRRLATEN